MQLANMQVCMMHHKDIIQVMIQGRLMRATYYAPITYMLT